MRLRSGLAWGLGALSIVILGCGQTPLPDPTKALEDLSKGAQQTVDNTVEKAKQAASLAGGFELKLEGDFKSSGCYATLAALPDRRNMLRLSSYNDPTNEGYPSIALFSQITQSGPQALAGQQLLAQVYVRKSAADPIWQSNQMVTVRITRATADSLTGEIVSGTVTNTMTGAERPLVGKFQAAWR